MVSHGDSEGTRVENGIIQLANVYQDLLVLYQYLHIKYLCRYNTGAEMKRCSRSSDNVNINSK